MREPLGYRLETFDDILSLTESHCESHQLYVLDFLLTHSSFVAARKLCRSALGETSILPGTMFSGSRKRHATPSPDTPRQKAFGFAQAQGRRKRVCH
jgi:hypothetical protein